MPRPPEVLEVTSLRSGRTTPITVFDSLPITIGTDPTKQLLLGSVNGHRVSLIERAYNKRFVQNWQAFRENRLATAPNLYVSTRDTMLVTNMKADGSTIYGKGYIQELTRRTGDRTAIDTLFLQLTETGNVHVLFDATRRYSDKATERGIILPDDDALDLVMQQTGNWQVMSLDLTRAQLGKRPTSSGVRGDNQRYGALFMSKVGRIREKLLDPSAPERLDLIAV